MRDNNRSTQLIGGLALAALCFARIGNAQESQLFTWRGMVDDEIRVVMNAGNVQSVVVGGLLTSTQGRADRANVLPRREGMVRVQVLQGRGLVRVIQQPDIANGYTAIVQIKDAMAGAGPYSFVTYFVPSIPVVSRGQIVESVGGEVSLTPGEPVLRWSGTVDGELQITLQRGRVGSDVVTGDRPRNVTTTLIPGGLPQREAQLALTSRQGRGTVAIVQQPTAGNGYIAIIRINDTAPGFSFYDFDVIWR